MESSSYVLRRQITEDKWLVKGKMSKYVTSSTVESGRCQTIHQLMARYRSVPYDFGKKINDAISVQSAAMMPLSERTGHLSWPLVSLNAIYHARNDGWSSQ